MTSAPDLIRVRILKLQPGPGFHAAVGETRTMHRAEGEALIAKGEAELLKSASPAAKPARKR